MYTVASQLFSRQLQSVDHPGSICHCSVHASQKDQELNDSLTNGLFTKHSSKMSNYTVIGSLFDDANAYQLPITALSFDPVSDTLWTGRSSGQVLARHSIQGIRGVQYTVDTHGPVIKIIAGETHVRALGGSGDGVGQWSKGGMNKWFSK